MIFTRGHHHHLALIFQHGETAEQYREAHKHAKTAVRSGCASAKWLVAASEDRLLLMQGKPQKYGTQFILNPKNEWELAQPIDPTITDEERIKYNVPPLENAHSEFKKKYKI